MVRREEKEVSDLNDCFIVGASLKGTSHEKNGLPCQDAHLEEAIQDDIVLFAVADGAGTSSMGQIGAKTAVFSIIEELKQRRQQLEVYETEDEWSSLMMDCFRKVQEKINKTALESEVEARELATTLILLVVRPECIVVAQIGDGAVVIEKKDRNILSLASPKTEEYVNQTTFLTSSNAIEELEVKLFNFSVSKLAIFTDGLQHLALKMPEGKAHEPFFRPLFSFIEKAKDIGETNLQLQEFLNSRKVREATEDDLTLVLARW